MGIGKGQKILIEAIQNIATKFLIKCVLERAQKVLMIDANSSQLKYDHNKEKAVGHILIVARLFKAFCQATSLAILV